MIKITQYGEAIRVSLEGEEWEIPVEDLEKITKYMCRDKAASGTNSLVVSLKCQGEEVYEITMIRNRFTFEIPHLKLAEKCIEQLLNWKLQYCPGQKEIR